LITDIASKAIKSEDISIHLQYLPNNYSYVKNTYILIMIFISLFFCYMHL